MKFRKNLTKILSLSIFVLALAFTSNSVGATSVPELISSQLNYKAGTLLKIKGRQGAAVYQIGSDGKKYVYPDQRTFDTWHDDFSEVQEVDLDELDNISDGGTVTFQPGTKLITHRNTAKVYAVGEDGDLTYIPNEKTARKFYGVDWYKSVLDIDPGIFAVSYKIKQGVLSDNNLPDGSLVEEEDTGTYYLIEGGQRRKVLKEALRLRNIIRKNIIKLKKLSNIYDDGNDIDTDDDISDFEIGRGNEKIVVCHKPELVNRTIRVSVRALEAHLAHGDVKGACIGNHLYDDEDENVEDVENVEEVEDIEDVENIEAVEDEVNDTTLADITISDIILEPDQFTANETIDIYVYIKNSGTVALTDTTGILNNFVSFEDFVETASSINPVISETEPFEADEIVAIVWTGYFSSTGEKTLNMTIDESNELTETDETNNTYTEVVTVEEDTEILPDITIDSIILEPDQFTANETIDIYVYIKNSGTVALTDTTGILNNFVSFEDFETTTLLPSYVPIISENNQLEPGERTIITWTGHFTSVGGDKRLYVVLDNANELEEADETNNTYTEYVNVL